MRVAPGTARQEIMLIIGNLKTLDEWSLGLIGNASGKNSHNEVELDPRRFR
jgi:hypothetical protein